VRRILLLFVLLSACTPAATEAPSGRRLLALLHLADLHSHLFPERVTLTARDVARGLGSGRGGALRDGAVGGSDLGDADARDAAVGDSAVVGGAARIATLLDQERARADVAVTLDAGDVFEGTAVFTLFGGVPEMRVAAALGVDAQALGNHDVAPGASLAALRGEAPHDPLLAANLELEGVDVATSIVVERGGLRVLVIGLGRSPDAVPDVATCAARVQQLLDARGAAADVTVVLSHLGSDLDTALIPRTTGIDVLLGGHTHDVLWPARTVKDCGPALAAERSCRPRAVPLVHSGAYGRYVGRVTLLVAPARRGAEERGRPASRHRSRRGAPRRREPARAVPARHDERRPGPARGVRAARRHASGRSRR
jgi:5'-nucleotidase